MKSITDFIVVLLIIAMLSAIVFYLVRQKKKGAGCIGCPYAGECCKKNCEHNKKGAGN